MTQQERNNQIALMLGYKPNKHNNGSFDDFYDEPQLYVSDLRFHSDWNWLMEAVIYCKSKIGIPTSVLMVCLNNDVIRALMTANKEEVFIAVSDFAQKFNNKEL